jgi:hypothetical protein
VTERTGEAKRVAKEVVQKIETHWSTWKGLAIKTRSNLSRREYMDLCVQLSQSYDESTQSYQEQQVLPGIPFPRLNTNANEKRVHCLAEKLFGKFNPHQTTGGRVVTLDLLMVLGSAIAEAEKKAEGEPVPPHGPYL